MLQHWWSNSWRAYLNDADNYTGIGGRYGTAWALKYFSRVEDDSIDSTQLLERHETQRDDESLHGAAWGHQVSQRSLVPLRFVNRVLHLSQFVLHVIASPSEPLQGLLSDFIPAKYISICRMWLTVRRFAAPHCTLSTTGNALSSQIVWTVTERASFFKFRQTISEYVVRALK